MTRSGWLVLTASARGASHVAMDTPNQDAVGTGPAGPDGVVAAVADGHGHWRHLRSARGSRLAVTVGCQVGTELAGRLPASPDAAAVTGLLTGFAVPAIITRWRDAVLADLAGDPFTSAEQERRLPGDDPVIAYGSTLLLAVAVREWLAIAQIGDGDVIGVRADGRADLPVPGDPNLDGLVTTSLCGADPAGDFRVAAVDTARVPLLALLLATDGYGNAQVAQEWPEAFSRDLAGMLRNRDEQWLASQLPAWAARCASGDGSADDTTVALLISPAGRPPLAATPPGSTGRDGDLDEEETTIPASRGDTVPSSPVPAEPDAAWQAAAPTAGERAAERPGPGGQGRAGGAR